MNLKLGIQMEHEYKYKYKMGIVLVTLTFDLLTLKLVRFIAHGVENLPTNFGVSGTFRSQLMGQQHCQMNHVTLRP